ncbi:hypothetical protein SLEP1_g6047 [Rubroshorea leprosula]|uniref:poly(ADP-ribose) glycohydrolase n=1 Tax=Rubroshorea leprosula TaxID=152421 RepID=A0AAV5I210_9ROSI|nr:hypothetical protein SLEP1_g6047 [Rubroshorea leprosula]
MEEREDLKSILPFLPLVIRSSSLLWPSQVVEPLKALSRGPDHSRVCSGEVLSIAIADIRASLSLFEPLARSAPQGYALFFDELISREDSRKWFEEVLPELANLLLRLPVLLETHYQNALRYGMETGLRILGPQEAGIVFLSQELVAALLACSFFCLFPITNRSAKQLPTINFDELFANLYESYSESHESKIKCIVHYFERICSQMPSGFVSFERKLLSLEYHPLHISYPKADFWGKSAIPLCPFEAHSSGLIEDHSNDALQVDFANKYLGGGALRRGCVQEEIRFMVNPELIAGMLFLPSMEDNEAIEIVGAERFSDYTGYASSFRFSGDCIDKRTIDFLGRRKTRIIAVDALCNPRMKQYELKYLLREINKALCGFLDQSKSCSYRRLFQEKGLNSINLDQDDKDHDNTSRTNILLGESPSTSVERNEGGYMNQTVGNSECNVNQFFDHQESIGIATGNWGCGSFGGDPEVKTIIQWLAASQALRPFISYYTFGLVALQNVNQVTQWILAHKWTVGDLWNVLVEYSTQRFSGQTNLGFFAWLLPSQPDHEAEC